MTSVSEMQAVWYEAIGRAREGPQVPVHVHADPESG